MKSRVVRNKIENKHVQSAKTQEFKYDLTIGIIVKNEAKELSRCINSLERLRKEINCQLIITDTGSTDGTKEIAKQHADVYLEFDWCDDFSAARNTGVEAAEGRWFVFFDADEFLDPDCDDIINFFKDPNNDLDYCEITIYNYKNTAYTAFATNTLQRFFNFSNGKRYFKGTIHEAVLIHKVKFCKFKTKLHHTGYLGTKFTTKLLRNDKLLLECIKKDPHDVRSYMQLGVSRKELDSIKIYEECLKNNEQNKSAEAQMYISAVLALLAKAYYANAYHKKLQILAERYFGDELTVSPYNLEVLLYLGLSNKDCGDFEQALKYLEGFQNMYQALIGNQSAETFVLPFFYNKREIVYLNNFLRIARCYFLLDEKEKAYQALKKSNALTFLQSGKPAFLSFYIDMLFNLERYDEIKEAYLKFYGNEEATKYIIPILERYFNPNEVFKQNLDLLALFCDEVKDGYTALNAVRLSGKDLTEDQKELVEILKSDPLVYKLSIFSPFVYTMLKTKTDILALIQNCSAETMIANLKSVFINYADYPDIVYDYLSGVDLNVDLPNKQLMFIKNLSYLYIANLANVHKTTTVTDRQIEFVLDVYVDCSMKLINKVYDLDKLSDNLELVSSELSAATVLFEARKHKQSDTILYLKLLKKALSCDQKLFKCLTGLIEKIEQNISQTNVVADEFAVLARNIKIQLRQLVSNGDLVNAKAIFEQYKKINPSDPDIETLSEIIK